MSITLSPQQGQAVDAVLAWHKTPSKIFKLAGFAGTGKTSIARFITEALAQKALTVIYGAFTGKAASVLVSKGCSPAMTIHSMIYRARLNELTGKWHFALDLECPAAQADLVVIDEASFVGDELGADLMRVAKKVLVLGDPGQLQPIKDTPYFDLEAPDFMLTEIHRQAAESPVLLLATAARLGEPIRLGDYGTSKVIKNRSFTDDMMLTHEQTLCGRNATRTGLNARYRKHTGASDYLPVVGDKLIALRNNRERGYLNGTMWRADEVTYESDAVSMMIAPLEGGTGIKTLTFNEYFSGDEDTLNWRQKMQNDEFCYGYVVTTHKFQGSQAESVLLVDESHVFREDARKWLYTGLTRAADRVTLVV